MPEPMFRIELLPARHGDALLVEYRGEKHLHRILIDGGPLGAYPAIEKRLSELPESDQAVELLVVTHVDTDHIEGIIRLLAMPEQRWPIYVKEVWFNGWRHIEEARDLGGREGELMSALIHYRLDDRWNTKFEGKAVRCGALPDDEVRLAGGMKLTMLSPDAEALAALLEDWKEKLHGEWEMEPGDLEAAWEKLVEENKYHPDSELTLGPEDLSTSLRKLLKGIDRSKANGSSIAFIAELEGTPPKRCIFLADAHVKVICASLKNLGYSAEKPIKVDAVKVSHHGSKNNINGELLSLVDAPNWLFSTDGSHHHGHPDEEAVRAVIDGSISDPVLWFNYRSAFNTKWEKEAEKPGARHQTRYPDEGTEGIVITL